nr:hypothetical protein [uncultured bacterium]
MRVWFTNAFGRKSLAAFLVVLLGCAVDAAALTFTVTSTGDGADAAPGNGVCAVAGGGGCTLRAAVQEANALAGPDTIHFAIGSGAQQILGSAVAITGPVVIDGWTQPGFSGTPLIQVRGGMTISGSGTTIRGLVVNGGAGAGIQVNGGGNHVFEGNYVGLDVTGATAVPNDGSGIRFSNSSNNRIGGTTPQQRNVISGNTPKGNGGGLEFDGGSGNQIKGNYIGTDVTGMLDRGNDGRGIALSGSVNNVIGGPEPGAGNLIAGNWATGIRILGGSNGTLVQGNIIGINAALNAALSNDRGVQIRGSHNNQVIGNTIGGQVYDGVLLWENSNNNRVFYNTVVYNGWGNRDPTEEAFNGVMVWDGVGNYVIGNRAWGNRDLGLRVGPAAAATAPTPPTVTNAVVTGGTTTITGQVTGPAGIEYVVDLFVSSECDWNGAGEGEYALGQVRVTAGANGVATFNVGIGAALPVGWLVTTTATKANANTSGYSTCKAIQ